MIIAAVPRLSVRIDMYERKLMNVLFFFDKMNFNAVLIEIDILLYWWYVEVR